MANLVLYYTQSCPYSQKVLRFIEQNNIKLVLKDTHEGRQNREDLIKIGGKSQVPCLVIDGQALYESDDIIEWLKNEFKRH